MRQPHSPQYPAGVLAGGIIMPAHTISNTPWFTSHFTRRYILPLVVRGESKTVRDQRVKIMYREPDNDSLTH